MKGESVMGILGGRALDIDVSERDLCLILGYLATPGRVGFIEAQIPEEKVSLFKKAYPNQECYPITQGKTSSGNIMKQGMQFRIYFNDIQNCPPVLLPFIGEGNDTYVKRINKGKFIEKIIENYGFRFGHSQDGKLIREQALKYHPQYIDFFDEGYSL